MNLRVMLYIQQNANVKKYNVSKIEYTSITNKSFTIDIYKLLFWSQIVDVALKWSSALRSLMEHSYLLITSLEV